MTQPDSLAAIIAEMREPENSGQFGPWQFTADNIKDWADRLAALAGAGPGGDESMALHWIDRYAAGIDDEPQMDRIREALAITPAEDSDWYVSPQGSVCFDLDLDGDTGRQLSFIAKRDGSVSFVAFVYGQKFIGNATGPGFAEVIAALAHAPAKAREDDARRVLEWLASEDTGMSSESIAYHMLGMYSEGSHPHDPADLGRCLRLLELFPEWKARIREMATYSRNWAALSARWEELAVIMDAEVGIDWSKGRNAPRTYEAMKAAMRAALATFAEGAE